MLGHILLEEILALDPVRKPFHGEWAAMKMRNGRWRKGLVVGNQVALDQAVGRAEHLVYVAHHQLVAFVCEGSLFAHLSERSSVV